MSDQTIQIKYVGTAQRWPEISITGRQSVWMPGQIESRSPSEASALLATGLFSSPPVPVTAVTSPGGGIVLSAGEAGCALPVLLQPRSLAFIGDSRARYGYQTWYYTAAKVTNNGGLRIDWLGCGVNTKLTSSYGNGTVEWRSEDKSLRWTAPGDTPGPWTAFSRAGEYTLESGTAGCWLRGRITSSTTLPYGDVSFSVAVSGDGRPRNNINGTSTEVAARFGLYLNEPAYMGAGGAHTEDCVEMLDWYAELAGGPGVDVIRVGTNDISAMQRTIQDTVALAYRLFDARRKIGRKLVICGEGARYSAGETPSAPMSDAQMQMLLALNHAYRSYAMQHHDACRYVDLFEVSYDPAYSDGRPKAGVLDDDVHESNAGVLVYAAPIAAAARELGMVNDPSPSALDSMIGTKTLMVGTSGTISTATTGVAPDGWRVRSLQASATVVSSVVPMSSGQSAQRIQCEVTAGADAATIHIDLSASMIFNNFGLAIGDHLQVFADFELVSGAVTSIEGMVYFNGSLRRGQVFFPPVVGRSMRVSVPIEIVPTDTSIRPQFYIVVPALGAATFRVGALGIRKVPAI